jgi:farnesyl-diphosphate farnesyltransferase
MNRRLQRLLQQTSRSFYRTLRVLPGAIRPQISLAYLLARTTDTIADTGIISVEQRLQALQKLRQRVQGSRSADLQSAVSPIWNRQGNDCPQARGSLRRPAESNSAIRQTASLRYDAELARLDFGELARHQGSPAERVLLERCEESLAALNTLSSHDAQLVREVLETIMSGQELDLRRFAGASVEQVVALCTDAELDDYTYRVAGCVGEFWTKMCRAHLFPNAKLDDARLLADAVRFGKGLQLVNILRDLPADLRQGRCYLPAERLAGIGLQPADLLKPENEPKLRPLYHEYLDLSQAHLAAGWAYTNALPRGQVRVRLACAWPILIGVRTLARLRSANVLDAAQRVKVSRAEVRGILLRSLGRYPCRRSWAGQFEAEIGAGRNAGKAVASGRDLP